MIIDISFYSLHKEMLKCGLKMQYRYIEGQVFHQMLLARNKYTHKTISCPIADATPICKEIKIAAGTL